MTRRAVLGVGGGLILAGCRPPPAVQGGSRASEAEPAVRRSPAAPVAAVADIDWVEIPSGVLVRGTPLADVDAIAAAHADIGVQRSWIAREAPRSELHVPAFAMARTQVTVAQWAVFAADVGKSAPDPRHPPDHPIDGVTWADASLFCAWLAEKTHWRVRLPTETEWERAARGGDAREYPWGDRYERGRGNLADLRLRKTTPVGSFPNGASVFGVLDLVGNVDEWTSSEYAPYPGAPSDAIQVDGVASDPHVTRGGGFVHNRDLARCARRHGLFPPTPGVGFRLVLG